MKKNAFTLVEMLTVVVILVTLGLVAIFSITGIAKKSTNELYEMQREAVIDAARIYAIERGSELANNNQITLCDLKKRNLIDEEFINPKTEERFDDSLIIEIVKNNETAEYEINFDGITQMTGYNCALKGISVKLHGNSPYYMNYGDEYVEPGIEVSKENSSGQMEIYSPSNYVVVKSGSFAENAIKLGSYDLIYTVTDTETNFTTSVTRKIVVKDNVAPTITLTPNQNQFVVLEGTSFERPTCFVTDNVDGQDLEDGIVRNAPICNIGGTFSDTNTPGTYEIVYTTKDSGNNTNTKVVTVIVRERNKNLIGKIEMDTLTWTNEDISIEVVPLYNKLESKCNEFLYSFNGGYDWQNDNTYLVEENGSYSFAIKYNSNECLNLSERELNSIDVFSYKFTNIDKDVPTFLVKNEETNEFENKARISLLTSNETILNKNGNYYYSKDLVNITNVTGAIDVTSGVEQYKIYINDLEFSDTQLTDEGIYKIEIQAVDFAGNESEKAEVAVLFIDKTLPVCQFEKCSGNACEENPSIYGMSVSFLPDDLKYGISILNHYSNENPAIFKFNCIDQYYDSSNLPYEELQNEISLEKFKVENEVSDYIESVVSSVELNNTSITCNNNICEKKYNYLITLKVSDAPSIEGDFIYLRALDNLFCDKANNCNIFSLSDQTNRSIDLMKLIR